MATAGAFYRRAMSISRYSGQNKMLDTQRQKPCLVWKAVSGPIITFLEDQFEHLEAEILVGMFLIGRNEKNCLPTVLFSSKNRSCRQQAMRMVKKKQFLACHPGVVMAESSRVPEPLALDDQLEMPILPPRVYLDGSLRSCGINVVVSRDIDTPPRRATIGGIVCVDDGGLVETYYGLTCAHAFEEASKSDSGSRDHDLEFAFYGLVETEDSSDDETDSVDITSQGSISSNSDGSETIDGGDDIEQKLPSGTDAISMDQGQPLKGSRKKKVILEESTQILDLGSLFEAAAPGTGLDWALVKIDHPEFQLSRKNDFIVNKIQSRNQVLFPTEIGPVSSDAEVLICTGSSDRTYEGTLSSVSSFRKPCGKKTFQEMWTVRCLNGSFTDGDCGSWVVDAERGILYGHIVSGYPGTGTAYVIPAVQIFEDMKHFFDKPVQLLTCERRDELLKRVQANLAMQSGHYDGQSQGENQFTPSHTFPSYESQPQSQPSNKAIEMANSETVSSSLSTFANPYEDWTQISDLAERRRIQNRIAQRNYRKKLKGRLEDLERRAGSSSTSPPQVHNCPAPDDILYPPFSQSQPYGTTTSRAEPYKTEPYQEYLAPIQPTKLPSLMLYNHPVKQEGLPEDETMSPFSMSYAVMAGGIAIHSSTSKTPPANVAYQNPPCNTLYVGGLPMDVTEDELKALFSTRSGYKRLCFRSKQNGPMCFVEFENVSFASQALQELYGSPVNDRLPQRMRLSYSKNPLGMRSSTTEIKGGDLENSANLANDMSELRSPIISLGSELRDQRDWLASMDRIVPEDPFFAVLSMGRSEPMDLVTNQSISIGWV